MPVEKIEAVIADHLESLIDYQTDPTVTPADDARSLINRLEKSGFEIMRRTSTSSRARLKGRRADWAR